MPVSVNDGTAIILLVMLLQWIQHSTTFRQEEPCPGYATYNLVQLDDGACRATIDAAPGLPCRL